MPGGGDLLDAVAVDGVDVAVPVCHDHQVARATQLIEILGRDQLVTLGAAGAGVR